MNLRCQPARGGGGWRTQRAGLQPRASGLELTRLPVPLGDTDVPTGSSRCLSRSSGIGGSWDCFLCFPGLRSSSKRSNLAGSYLERLSTAKRQADGQFQSLVSDTARG